MSVSDSIAPRRLGFADHPRDVLGNRYVYCVLSRRAQGVSVGINLNPDKVCNFACPYCQVDRTKPGGPARIDLAVLEKELDELLSRAATADFWVQPPFETVDPDFRRVADVAFSGDGEPTTPPEFPAAARLARRLKDEHRLAIPLRLLTNATMLHRGSVRGALPEFDELWCKLDAGTEGYFRAVNGAVVPLDHVLSNLLSVARERPVVVQSMFITLSGVGPGEEEIAAYRRRLAALRSQGAKIDRVQICTLARRPADPRVGPLSIERLEAICRGVRDLGIQADVYGAPFAEEA
jgi:wyosine [tRNA(Phe)-imidazoG37] synthetase (radical SAM superfamily)